MDENRMQLALTLAVGAAMVFGFFMLKRFLGVMKFSLRAVLCLAVFAAIAALVWSRRFPVESF